MSKRKFGTYLIEFQDGEQIITGNNYKSWWIHGVEYARGRYGEFGRGTMNRHQVAGHVKSVMFSETTFADDGGLKYVMPGAYDEMIDEMYAADKQKRPYFAELKFEPYDVGLRKLRTEIVKW